MRCESVYRCDLYLGACTAVTYIFPPALVRSAASLALVAYLLDACSQTVLPLSQARN